MKIRKKLNNNAVIVVDEAEEKIAIGSGVGFDKQKNDLVNAKKIEKLFVLKENKKLQQLLLRIPEEHFTLSEEIITYAEKQLRTELNDHIRVQLADHISFAIEREQNGIQLKNALLREIKVLYQQEFEIGMWALERLKTEIGVKMPVDEAAFIALYIHTMKVQGGDIHETVRQTTMVQTMVQRIRDYLNIAIDEADISYERLVTHLQFALTRAKYHDSHVMDKEMFDMIKQKYDVSYQCAKRVAEEASASYGITLPEEELGYITLHIERLRTH
ncbi:transcriptional antiterminator, BglG family [Lentibacillus halodurans]|uniref:Transcriptional antiterminator, BglG family n=1 Tax=Lentibacillus halodurans TaxID=237679 RepID=A0A1I0Z7Q6_9BACI|nr:PRD domain-containing protein [Lentibacillus halodurans]SFB21551.1 transcriptional antiterminator, BglG family [Lentibacillus halodurans]